MAYKQKQSSCAKMVDAKGKPSGLMMAGSAYHMESINQEKKNLVNDMPIDGKASAMEMSPYKMGHESPAELNGTSGGSAFYETDPEEKKSSKTSKDKLPSYDTTTYEASASGGGSGMGTKTVSKEVYTPPKRTAKGDAAYAKLTPQQRKSQDDKYKKIATKTVKTEVPISGGQKSKESTSTKRTTIGTQTMGQIEKAGSIQSKNRLSEMSAKSDANLIQAKKDSINAANKTMKSFPTDVMRSSEKGRMLATRAGEKAGYHSLRQSGSYDQGQAREQFNPDFGKMQYDTKVTQEKGLFKKEKKQRVKKGRITKIGKSGGYAK